MKKERLKVYIHCKSCGERYTLRGTRNGQGHLGTGFKRCLCDNEKEFTIRSEDF